MPSLLLATYGTLMRSFDAQDRLGVRDRLSFVGDCRWEGRLYDLGRFPGAVPGDGRVQGELFRLSSPTLWTPLDDYEGYDPKREAASLFVRRRVELRQPSGRTAWVYWFNGTPEEARRIRSGDWARHVRRRDGE